MIITRSSTSKIFIVLIVLFQLHRLENDMVEKSAPNIVVISSSKLGWKDVGFHGNTNRLTPNLNALARNGVILNSHYISPWRFPTMVEFFTGNPAFSFGYQNEVKSNFIPVGLETSNQKLISEMLRENGYRTSFVGRWGLGYYNESLHPLNRGFDSFFGSLSFHPLDYRSHLSKDVNISGYDLWRNMTQLKDSLKNEFYMEILGDECKNQIEDFAEDITKPFFLFASFQAPEIPSGMEEKMSILPMKWQNYLSQTNLSEKQKLHNGLVLTLDVAVGKIVDALNNKNILKNTIVLFYADSTSEECLENPDKSCNDPLRGGYGTMWEGGVRSTALIHSPLINISGRVCHDLIHVSDWYKTFLSLIPNVNSVDEKYRYQQSYNVWDTICNAGTSPRKYILESNDNKDGKTEESLRFFDFKLIHNPHSHGNDWARFSSAKFLPKIKTTLNSIDSQFNSTKSSEIDELQCDRGYPHPFLRMRAPPCKPEAEYCLFNIDWDPCEYHNLVDFMPRTLRFLQKKMMNLKSIPSFYRDPIKVREDSAADPSTHSGSWTPWKLFETSTNVKNKAQSNVTTKRMSLISHDDSDSKDDSVAEKNENDKSVKESIEVSQKDIDELLMGSNNEMTEELLEFQLPFSLSSPSDEDTSESIESNSQTELNDLKLENSSHPSDSDINDNLYDLWNVMDEKSYHLNNASSGHKKESSDFEENLNAKAVDQPRVASASVNVKMKGVDMNTSRVYMLAKAIAGNESVTLENSYPRSKDREYLADVYYSPLTFDLDHPESIEEPTQIGISEEEEQNTSPIHLSDVKFFKISPYLRNDMSDVLDKVADQIQSDHSEELDQELFSKVSLPSNLDSALSNRPFGAMNWSEFNPQSNQWSKFTRFPQQYLLSDNGTINFSPALANLSIDKSPVEKIKAFTSESFPVGDLNNKVSRSSINIPNDATVWTKPTTRVKTISISNANDPSHSLNIVHTTLGKIVQNNGSFETVTKSSLVNSIQPPNYFLPEDSVKKPLYNVPNLPTENNLNPYPGQTKKSEISNLENSVRPISVVHEVLVPDGENINFTPTSWQPKEPQPSQKSLECDCKKLSKINIESDDLVECKKLCFFSNPKTSSSGLNDGVLLKASENKHFPSNSEEYTSSLNHERPLINHGHVEVSLNDHEQSSTKSGGSRLKESVPDQRSLEQLLERLRSKSSVPFHGHITVPHGIDLLIEGKFQNSHSTSQQKSNALSQVQSVNDEYQSEQRFLPSYDNLHSKIEYDNSLPDSISPAQTIASQADDGRMMGLSLSQSVDSGDSTSSNSFKRQPALDPKVTFSESRANFRPLTQIGTTPVKNTNTSKTLSVPISSTQSENKKLSTTTSPSSNINSISTYAEIIKNKNADSLMVMNSSSNTTLSKIYEKYHKSHIEGEESIDSTGAKDLNEDQGDIGDVVLANLTEEKSNFTLSERHNPTKLDLSSDLDQKAVENSNHDFDSTNPSKFHDQNPLPSIQNRVFPQNNKNASSIDEKTENSTDASNEAKARSNLESTNWMNNQVRSHLNFTRIASSLFSTVVSVCLAAFIIVGIIILAVSSIITKQAGPRVYSDMSNVPKTSVQPQ